LSSAPKAASPGCGWTCRRIDKAGRGVQASLARRDGYGPLIPWAEAPRLPSNHRYAVPQEVQTPGGVSYKRLLQETPHVVSYSEVWFFSRGRGRDVSTVGGSRA
jgi:hypothetical protein